MRVGLMADVPHEPVLRRVEHVVQRHRELDDAESRREVPARARHGVDQAESQLVGQRGQVVHIEPPQVGRDVDAV